MKHSGYSKNLKSTQKGLSLVELLVALALSGTLMAGVVGVFMGMFQGDRSVEGVSRMQETGRFALNFLSQDIRMAGYLGCSSTLDKATINNTLAGGGPASFQPDRSIQGWEATGTDPGQTNNAVVDEAVTSTAFGWGTSGGNVIDNFNAIPGTDFFRVWSIDQDVEGTLNSIDTSGNPTVINVNNDAGIAATDILLLSNCEDADWVQACDLDTATAPAGTVDLELSGTCAPGNIASAPITVASGGTVMKLAGTVYYIGKRGDTSTNPPALFRRQLDDDGTVGAAEELVEGVEDMQILYGENTNNDASNSADRFIPADQVTTWDNVVSVRISLLVRSIEDNLVPAPQAYTFNGEDYDGESGNGSLPPDGRLRRVFTSTINLRNVTLGG